MGKKQETIFKEKAIERLKKIPCSYWVKIQQVALRGVPDLLGVVDGRAIAIELKVSAKVDTLQHYVLRQYEKAGAYARVMTPDNIDDIIRDLIGMVSLEKALAAQQEAQAARALLAEQLGSSRLSQTIGKKPLRQKKPE